eukprot:Skav210236  [mRNA]  locus=scaffold2884:131885:133867:+ [translate_table: standard]
MACRKSRLDAAIERCNTEHSLKEGLTPDMLHSILALTQDGQYLVASTPGSVNEAWLEKVLGEQQAGLESTRPGRSSDGYNIYSLEKTPMKGS